MELKLKTIQTYSVAPKIPENMKKLFDVMNNLWWTWTPSAIALFDRMDRSLWHETHHNPTLMMTLIKQDRLESLAEDPIFLSNLEKVHSDLTNYIERKTWFDIHFSESKNSTIAYFSLEFGIHECLPVYSGGLGILAGDHLKSASELGLPLVGVGLLYRYGYFRQHLTRDGWQHELYPKNDFLRMPITLVRNPDKSPVLVGVEFPGKIIYAQIWKVDVGRIQLYLLDTDNSKNNSDDRLITSHLYGGNEETRLKQEMILGIGGIRALSALNINPSTCHANEGHAALLFFERLQVLIKEKQLTFHEAHQVVASSSIFTTHTPVPAGIDRFPNHLVRDLLTPYLNSIDISIEDLFKLCSDTNHPERDPLNMAILALRMAHRSNGVSKLHGEVSRRMWEHLWPDIPVNEVPIAHITNGVHLLSWISDEMAKLFDRYLGPRWIEDPVNTQVWQRVTEIPDSELWTSKERLRHRLISFARKTAKKQLIRNKVSPYEISKADEILDPDALTIGFARRFATYKRATLLFSNPERLKRILLNPNRPVQIILAGKAHPQDNAGKEFIKEIIRISNTPELHKHVVFIEDYDIAVARYLVQGVDVWLNNPRRPMEASGTSGMKVPANGGINLSILDGWWPEAYNGQNGWAIGGEEDFVDHQYQDQIEANLLYDILENEVVPRFYFRDANDIPRDWISTMKESMRTCCPMFNTNRMLREYTEKLYIPAINQWKALELNQFSAAKELVKWKDHIQKAWPLIQIKSVTPSLHDEMQVGDDFEILVDVDLNTINPDNVAVEVLTGELDADERLTPTEIHLLKLDSSQNKTFQFKGNITHTNSGRFGFTVRVRPHSHHMTHEHELCLTRWW